MVFEPNAGDTTMNICVFQFLACEVRPAQAITPASSVWGPIRMTFGRPERPNVADGPAVCSLAQPCGELNPMDRLSEPGYPTPM